MDWIIQRSPASDGGGSGAPIGAQEGAAGLLVAAAQVDGSYTEVEKERVNKALMKVFQLASPAASKLRESAETLTRKDVTLIAFAQAAKGLESDTREKVLTWVWDVLDRQLEAENPAAFVGRIADCWTMPRERAKALRASSPSKGAA